MARSGAQGGSHPWEETYPANVDWHAPLPTGPLHRLLDEAVARFGDRPAIDFMDRITTYRALGDQVNRAAEGFQKLGVGKGTKVGILLPNCPAFVAVYYGVLKAGGTVVNVNPLYAIEEIKFQIEDAEADFLVTLDLSILYDKARLALDQTRLKHLVIVSMAADAARPQAAALPHREAQGDRQDSARFPPTSPSVRCSTTRAGPRPSRWTRRKISRCCSTPAAPPGPPRARC